MDYKTTAHEILELKERIRSLEMSIAPKRVDDIINSSLKHMEDIDALREKARLLSLYLLLKNMCKSRIKRRAEIVRFKQRWMDVQANKIRCNVG